MIAGETIDEVVGPRIREDGGRRDDDGERDGGPDAKYVVPVEVARFGCRRFVVEEQARLERGPFEDARQPEIHPAQDQE